jgi:hypothetical protein
VGSTVPNDGVMLGLSGHSGRERDGLRAVVAHFEPLIWQPLAENGEGPGPR